VKESAVKHAAIVAIILLIASAGFSREKIRQSPHADTRDNVPKEKQTTLGLYLTAAEAFDRWKSEPLATVVLDVRTPAEYVFVGHAPMAYNVPFAFWQPDVFPPDGKPVMKPNPDFLDRVRKIASPDDTLLVMCRSGERGAKACNVLAAAGFKKVYHVFDGFEGDEINDPTSAYNGKRMKNGWRNASLPWTYKLARNLMYLPAKP
jgi:rhodanese-related sulfurtransferase